MHLIQSETIRIHEKIIIKSIVKDDESDCIYRVTHPDKINLYEVISSIRPGYHADIVINGRDISIKKFNGNYMNYPHIKNFGSVKRYSWKDFNDLKTFKDHPHILYNDNVVIKTILMLSTSSSLKQEILTYLKLPPHPSIAEFLGVIVNNDYVEGFVIKKYNEITSLTEPDIRNLYSAIKHISKHVSFHGDVSPSNIVRDNNGVVKLIDCAQNGYTRDWAAPEVIEGKKPDFLSDLYSLGLIAQKYGINPNNMINEERCKRRL